MNVVNEMRIGVLMAVRNRRDTTLACIEELERQFERLGVAVQQFVVDDASTDGTAEAIRAQHPEVRLIDGSGDLYWGGAMRLAEAQALESPVSHLLWVNDDAALDDDAIERLLGAAAWLDPQDAIVCSAFRDPLLGTTTYSGVKVAHGPLAAGFWLERVEPTDHPLPVDSFNGNLVLVPVSAARKLKSIGPFTHHYGDFDYGLRASEARIPVVLAPGYAGSTRRNGIERTHRDTGMSRRERLDYLFGPKGYPFTEKATYLRRHGGWAWPLQLVGVHCFQIFKILIGR